MIRDRHYAADANELISDGSRILVGIFGKEIAIFRLDGEYFALANHCPHQAGPLCEGELTGKIGIGTDGWDLWYEEETYIEWPWHSWQFDVKTGENAADERYRVPTYDVRLEDGKLYVLV